MARSSVIALPIAHRPNSRRSCTFFLILAKLLIIIIISCWDVALQAQVSRADYSTALNGLSGIASARGSRPLFGWTFLQLETGSASQMESIGSDVQNCMRARARVRSFSGFSWLSAIALALGLYMLMMLIVPHQVPASWKWFLSPILAAFFMASIVAYFEDYQLTHYCGDINDWRIDTLGKVFLINWVVTLMFFSAWAALRYVLEGRRLRALKSQ